MLALLEREIVQMHGWLSATEFVDIIAVAEVTPGAVAINSATFVGYQIAGLAGAAISTFGVILPSLLLVIPVPLMLIALGQRQEQFCICNRKSLLKAISRSYIKGTADKIAAFSIQKNSYLFLRITW